ALPVPPPGRRRGSSTPGTGRGAAAVTSTRRRTPGADPGAPAASQEASHRRRTTTRRQGPHPAGEAGARMTDVTHQKWWGWGVEGIAFHHEDKPHFAPFVLEEIGIDLSQPGTPPPDFDDIDVPASRLRDQ